MEDVERMLKGTVERLERLLNAENVVGTPIEKDGVTIIPMVSYGFGFGVGGGSEERSGHGRATGAAGGIKPVGAIIVDQHGARIEGMKGPKSGLVEAVGDAASRLMEQSGRNERDGKERPSSDEQKGKGRSSSDQGKSKG